MAVYCQPKAGMAQQSHMRQQPHWSQAKPHNLLLSTTTYRPAVSSETSSRRLALNRSPSGDRLFGAAGGNGSAPEVHRRYYCCLCYPLLFQGLTEGILSRLSPFEYYQTTADSHRPTTEASSSSFSASVFVKAVVGWALDVPTAILPIGAFVGDYLHDIPPAARIWGKTATQHPQCGRNCSSFSLGRRSGHS